MCVSVWKQFLFSPSSCVASGVLVQLWFGFVMNVLKWDLGKDASRLAQKCRKCAHIFYVQASFWSSVNRYAKINPSLLLRIRLKNFSGCSHVGSLFTNEQKVPALPLFPLPMNSRFPLYHCSRYQWTAGSHFTIVPSLPMNSMFLLYHCSLYQWTAGSLFTIVPSLPMNSRFPVYQ